MKKIKGKNSNDWAKEMNTKEVVYPSLYVDEKEIPEIENWKVGEEYILKIKVKMTTKDEFESGAATNARLEVVAYEDLTDYQEDPSNPKTGAYGYNPK